MMTHDDLGNGASLRYDPTFLDRPRADALLHRLFAETNWEQHHFRGGLVPRLEKWVGDFDYTYSGVLHPATPWNPLLCEMRALVEERVFGHSAGQFQGVLLNLYRDGRDSVGFHADDEPMIKPDAPIASLSLGAERRFIMRERRGQSERTLVLAHGSLLIMGGTMQRHWLHALPKDRSLHAQRINLTFREYGIK